MANMHKWLKISDLHFSYNSHAKKVFAGLSLAAGEESPVVVFIGASGIGKSTLIGLLGGHVRPQQGHIDFFGAPINGPSSERAVVFQEYYLFPWKSALKNVEFGLKCAKVPPGKRREVALALLKRFKLEGTEDLFPAMLSGGMKQRLGLARALAVSPKCLLMDEPFSSLDNEIKESLCLLISHLVTEQNFKIVLVTHDLSEAVFLGNLIITLKPDYKISNYSIVTPPHPRNLSFKYSPEFLEHMRYLQARELSACST